jgi:2-(1,2-epoxy-1,2-dihydrophenyl)acetyl-CoA isomerase
VNEKLLLSVSEGIATLTFNRPGAMNALDDELILALRGAAERLEADEAVRAVLLRGAGPAFLAGGDVSVFHAHLPELPRLILEWTCELHRAIAALRRMKKPVVASVHGAAAGAGLSLVAACDLTIAAHDAKFTLAYSRIGASPDGGGTYFLPRLVGLKKALELALLSDTLDAETARRIGLVNFVVPAERLEQETANLMRRLASGPTYAYGETKALFNQSLHNTLDAQLDAESQAFARCAASADLKEGVTAFVEKRKPVFAGR